MTRRKSKEAPELAPVIHYPDAMKLPACRHVKPERADGHTDKQGANCRQCLSIVGPSYWRLQLERRPGEWIDTPFTKRGVQRPKRLAWDASGRATRWVLAGLVAES